MSWYRNDARFREFVQVAAEQSPLDYFQVEELCRLLSRAEFVLHRMAEEDCNGLPDKRQAAHDRRWDRLVNKAWTRATALGAELEVSGDPRGAVLRLLWPLDARGRRPANSFGGNSAGWYVPCRKP